MQWPFVAPVLAAVPNPDERAGVDHLSGFGTSANTGTGESADFAKKQKGKNQKCDTFQRLQVFQLKRRPKKARS